MQNFRALGAPPPEPRASGGWGLCPQTPSLRRLGASSPDPHWSPAAGGSAPRPPKQPPHCEFLATRLFVLLAVKHRQETSSEFVKWTAHLEQMTTMKLGDCYLILTNKYACEILKIPNNLTPLDLNLKINLNTVQKEYLVLGDYTTYINWFNSRKFLMKKV